MIKIEILGRNNREIREIREKKCKYKKTDPRI